jgi:AraC-like DNA-binding protein
VLISHQTTSVFQHLKYVITDPDEFDDALSGGSLKVDVLGTQSLPARVEQFQSSKWTLDFGEVHVKARARGALPPGWASLGFMRGGGPSIWHGMPAGTGTLMCNPPGGDGPDGHVTPGFAWSAIGVPTSLWESCQALAGAEVNCRTSIKVERWQLPAPLFALLDRQLRQTQQLLQSALAKPELVGFAERAAVDFVTNIATHAWEMRVRDHSLRISFRNRAYLARCAEVWMRDRLGEPIRIPDICLALRVSRRELEYAFRSTFDTSPREFLHKLRLNAIHRALRHSDPTNSIIGIAFDHGITHLSRFAADYRALFGEKPSDTLRTRRFDPAPARTPPYLPSSISATP